MKHKETPILEVRVDTDPSGIVEFTGEIGTVIMIPFKGTAQGPLFNGIVEPCGVDNQIINQNYRYIMHAANNLFGVYNTTSAPEQKAKMLQQPPVEKAKAVVPFLKEQLFTAPRWIVDVPYADRVYVNADETLERVANHIVPGIIMLYRGVALHPQYPAADYLKDLENAIFQDFNTSKPLDAYERYLQRTFVNRLCVDWENLRDNSANDAVAALLLTLKDLSAHLQGATTGAKRSADATTAAHYALLAEKLQRALAIK